MVKEQEAAENAAQTGGQDEVEMAEEYSAGEATSTADGDMNPEDLHLMLEDARNKADEHWDQLLRAKAEYENLQRRHERDLENAHKFAL
ncbi:MAG: nucleotide exchange factor GrpE, partial [Gammaproteobacteria bacterium]|nr:nucleotide exchange factor GrpE [Gammaproteobacteria bacterium]